MAKGLTTGQAAKMLSVDRSTISRGVDSGKFPNHWRTAGGHIRIPRTDVERLLGQTNNGQALLFIRVPRDGQHLIDPAIAYLTRYAMSKELSIVGVVREIGPGVQHQRPTITSLRMQIRSRKTTFSTLIVETLDRLLLLGAEEFVVWAQPTVQIEVAGPCNDEAREVYHREVLQDLYYPLADLLTLRGLPPSRVQNILSGGLDTIVRELGL